MAQVLVRNLDDDTVARLKRGAEAEGLSLEAYLRRGIEQMAGPSRSEILAQIDAIREKTKQWRPGDPTSVDYVREGRVERERTGPKASARK